MAELQAEQRRETQWHGGAAKFLSKNRALFNFKSLDETLAKTHTVPAVLPVWTAAISLEEQSGLFLTFVPAPAVSPSLRVRSLQSLLSGRQGAPA
jgi:hypothetical protein